MCSCNLSLCYQHLISGKRQCFRFSCDRIVWFCISFDTDFSFHAEYAQLFATLIARTAKDVDVLIDSLPSEESTSALQVIRGGDA